MGYVMVLGPCLNCKQVFSYNPHKVPSHPWPPPDGPREPICSDCIVLINAKRRERGLPEWSVDPDAYEAIEEGAL